VFSESMHIVFICSEYPYAKKPTGGFGTYVDQISRELVNQGHRATIITRADGKDQKITKKNITIFVIHPFGFNFLNKVSFYSPFFKRIIAFFLYPFLFSLAVHQKLISICRNESIDIIEGGDFGAELFFYLLLKKQLAPQVIIKLHTPSFLIRKFNKESNTVFYKTLYLLEKYCIQKADFVYSPTKSLAEIVVKEYKIDVKEIIPYPYSMRAIKGKNVKRRKNLVLYVGKMQRKKGVFVLINAIKGIVKRQKDIRFVFIGQDTLLNGVSTRKILIEKLRKDKIESFVTFVDPIPQKKLYEYYRRAAITIVPSLWENFPNVILEAMNNGSAIIASKVGGIIEMIKHNKNGLLVEPAITKELERSVLKLLSNANLRDCLAQQAKKDIDVLCNPSKIVKCTIEFYKASMHKMKKNSRLIL